MLLMLTRSAAVLLFTAAATAGLAAELITGKVVSITDGDTLQVRTDDERTLKIRMHGIDCPERKQPFGTKAKDALGDLAFGKAATLMVVDVDRYGRTVAKVLVDGQDVGEELLRQGMAWHYSRYDKSREYARATAEARKAKRGLWSDPNAVPPWDWRRTESQRKR